MDNKTKIQTLKKEINILLKFISGMESVRDAIPYHTTLIDKCIEVTKLGGSFSKEDIAEMRLQLN